MILWGIIIFVLSGGLWFLASSSIEGNPVLGPIYGQLWTTIFMFTGLVGLILIIVGALRRGGRIIEVPTPKKEPK